MKTLNPRGFTLLEVIIAMSILAFITMFTAQSIQKALQNRKQIQGDIDRVSGVRDALRIMENDINKSFNFRDINIALYNETVKERNRKIEEAKNKGSAGGITIPNQPTQPNPLATAEPLPPRKEVIVTQFLGEKNKLDFTTLSNAHVSSEDKSSDQAKVGYFLRDCKGRVDKTKTSSCLVRRISPILDEDVTKGGSETVLLENVTRFEMRYLGPGKPTEWIDSWFTNERGDDITKGVFPYAVEITIEVQDKTDKTAKPTRMTIVGAIRNPNNPVKKEGGVESPDALAKPQGTGT